MRPCQRLGLLATHPGLLAGDQIDRARPRRWMLIKREVGIPGSEQSPDRWSVDHLFLDQDAIPTLIEVKRSTDTRIRREVVGQMLDYAANAVAYWPGDRLRADFEARCSASQLNPDERIREELGRTDAETFWQEAKTNLQAGRIRLVFVADLIPQELRRIVEFLNQQMDPAEVLAVEIRQFTNESASVRTLVPTVIGQTAEAQQRKGKVAREKRQWSVEDFYAELSMSRPAGVVPARRLEEWAASRKLDISRGDGVLVGSFIPAVVHGGVRHYLFSVRTNGVVELEFGYLKSKPPFDSREKRLELVRRLNAIESVQLGDDRVDGFPSIPLEVLAPTEALASFIVTFDWVVDEIRAE